MPSYMIDESVPAQVFSDGEVVFEVEFAEAARRTAKMLHAMQDITAKWQNCSDPVKAGGLIPGVVRQLVCTATQRTCVHPACISCKIDPRSGDCQDTCNKTLQVMGKTGEEAARQAFLRMTPYEVSDVDYSLHVGLPYDLTVGYTEVDVKTQQNATELLIRVADGEVDPVTREPRLKPVPLLSPPGIYVLCAIPQEEKNLRVRVCGCFPIVSRSNYQPMHTRRQDGLWWNIKVPKEDLVVMRKCHQLIATTPMIYCAS